MYVSRLQITLEEHEYFGIVFFQIFEDEIMITSKGYKVRPFYNRSIVFGPRY